MGEIIENNKMKRQPGHYWVKYKGKWIIALWEQLTEKLGSFQIGNPEENEMPVDGDFEEIDERRIERPNHQLQQSIKQSPPPQPE